MSRKVFNRGNAKKIRSGDEHLRGMSAANLSYVSAGLGEEVRNQQPHLVMLEDYSGGRTKNAFILACTGEVTGAFKLWLMASRLPWFEVASGTLKKFVTGKGSGKKDVVWLGAYKRWGVDQEKIGSDDNNLDSYCLARFGLAMLLHNQQMYDPTKAELECFEAIRPGGAPRSMGKKGGRHGED